MSWHNLIGTPKYYAGASGTVQIGKTECVLYIFAHASAGGATMQMFGGQSLPIINGANGFWVQFHHALFTGNIGGASAGQIVFTGTDQYYVHTVAQGSGSQS